MKMNVMSGQSGYLYSIYVCVCLALLVQKNFVQASNCTQDDRTYMQNQFTQCSEKVTNSYQNSIEGGNLEGPTCTLFTDLLGDCSKIWKLCHSEEDISKMKDMQLEALLGQYVDSGIVHLEDCPIVNEYWSNTESYEGSVSADTCTDRQYVQTQTKFQTCSHQVSSLAYKSFLDITDTEVIADVICDALKNLSMTCPEVLKECFGELDVLRTLKMHLEEIQKYLIGLSPVELPESALNNCSVIADLGDVPEYEYDYYDYDEPSTEDTSKNVQEILTSHRSQEPADQPTETSNQNLNQEQEEKVEEEPADEPAEETAGEVINQTEEESHDSSEEIKEKPVSRENTMKLDMNNSNRYTLDILLYTLLSFILYNFC